MNIQSSHLFSENTVSHHVLNSCHWPADAFREVFKNVYQQVVNMPIAVEVVSRPSGGHWLPSNAYLNTAFCPELISYASRVLTAVHLSDLRHQAFRLYASRVMMRSRSREQRR